MLFRFVFSLLRGLTYSQLLIVFMVIALVFLSCAIFASIDTANEQDPQMVAVEPATTSLISPKVSVNPVP